MISAAIVLAGGRSTRMGHAKAALEWHGSTLVRRAVGIVARAVDGPVVVVRGPGQPLPTLPADVVLTEDEREARGPLQGMAAGVAAIGERADIVFVTAVDAPLLHPALVRHVVASLRPGDDVALPRAHGFSHPLTAAYRAATIAPLLSALLAQDRLAMHALVERCRVRTLGESALLADPAVAALDPALDSLLSLNTPAEYEDARTRPAPEVTVAGRGSVRAATLAAVGEGPAAVNGRTVSDPQEPLVAGDTISFAGH